MGFLILFYFDLFFVDEKRFIMTKMAMMTLMVMVDDYVL